MWIYQNPYRKSELKPPSEWRSRSRSAKKLSSRGQRGDPYWDLVVWIKIYLFVEPIYPFIEAWLLVYKRESIKPGMSGLPESNLDARDLGTCLYQPELKSI